MVPDKGQIKPRPDDVLFRKGNHSHPGNAAFRRLVATNKARHADLAKAGVAKAKEKVLTDSVQEVQRSNGRFLHRPWQVVKDQDRICSKVVQSLRDYKYEGQEAEDRRLFYETEKQNIRNQPNLWSEEQRQGRERHEANRLRVQQEREALRLRAAQPAPPKKASPKKAPPLTSFNVPPPTRTPPPNAAPPPRYADPTVSPPPPYDAALTMSPPLEANTAAATVSTKRHRSRSPNGDNDDDAQKRSRRNTASLSLSTIEADDPPTPPAVARRPSPLPTGEFYIDAANMCLGWDLQDPAPQLAIMQGPQPKFKGR